MPNSILLLLLLAVAVLALVDVGLGHTRHGHFGFEGALERISLREFLTRPLPIFLLGVGVAMLPVRTVLGAALLLAAAGLYLAGRRARCLKAEECPGAS
jgi:hypothetical protein